MDLMKADEIYKNKLKENPHFDHDLIMTFREEMPEEFCDVMMMAAYGCHIFNEDMYNKAVGLLESKSGMRGANWTLEQVKDKSGINFEDKDYTLYDYAYALNALYSDYSTVFTDSGYYIKMAKMYLEDPDFYGDPSERAFYDAKQRIKYNQDD